MIPNSTHDGCYVSPLDRRALSLSRATDAPARFDRAHRSVAIPSTRSRVRVPPFDVSRVDECRRRRHTRARATNMRAALARAPARALARATTAKTTPRTAATTTPRAARDDARDDAPAVSRRATALSLGAVALAAAPFSTARARGLPEFECAGDYVDSPTGLRSCDVVVGEGAAPTANQTIKAHYTGRLENGRVFDSSYERGSPLKFQANQVIKGWGIGILGDGDGLPPMRVGGKRKLVIPAELGYGQRGAGGVIPPNATLYFDVELVAIV
jgi:peptidylprolyl isomerase